MNLREELIKELGTIWPGPRSQRLRYATRALDALVGFLEDHADEWWETAKTLPQFKSGGPTMERRLLAVLASEDIKKEE